jgi:hypothetical protein
LEDPADLGSPLSYAVWATVHGTINRRRKGKTTKRKRDEPCPS